MNRLLVAAIFLSGCTTTNVINAYHDKPSLIVTERGQVYRVRISYEREEALITRSLVGTVGDTALQYGQRQLAQPELGLTWQAYQKNNAKRALKTALGDCTLKLNGDGSSVFFALNSAYTVFAGDVECPK